jgi:hypothetical protein
MPLFLELEEKLGLFCEITYVALALASASPGMSSLGELALFRKIEIIAGAMGARAAKTLFLLVAAQTCPDEGRASQMMEKREFLFCTGL